MKNRDMFYQNINQGYTNPGMLVPPSGYNINTQMQAYGPNMNQFAHPNITEEQMGYYNNNNELDERLNKIERQIKNLDTRLQKLENVSNETNDNIYMI